MKKIAFLPLWVGLLLLSNWACKDTATATSKDLDERQAQTHHIQVSANMVEAANHFLNALSEGQKQEAVFEAKEDERYDWHFVPQDDRKGTLLRDMNSAQRDKVVALMKSVLSDQGFEKAESIRALESILREVENRPDDDWYRNPEKYYFSIFGTPSLTQDWGWRMEGHHLSLNFSATKGEIVAVTPSFMGTNPAIVRTGSKTGTEVLKQEQELARAFVKAMSEEQFAKALIDPTAPEDIFTFVDRVVKLDEFIGLAASEMNDDQKTALRQLLSVYTNNMDAEIAEDQWSRIEDKGFDNLYFAWAGGIEAGEGHYYRIHGPSILVEYDNVQNGNNHIHTVWRDLQHDFGGDLLKKHYQDHKH
ncbi:MAG: DUF3500 domain-containing protein [Bacteroidota bacterium]